MNERLKAALEGLKTAALKNKKAALLLAAAALLLFSLAFSELAADRADAPKEQGESGEATPDSDERRLERLLGKIDGVGEVSVMITYERAAEYVYATNSDESLNQGSRQSNKSEYVIIDTDSGDSALKLTDIYPLVRGVAVVCQGADNAAIKEKIIATVSALFDISSTKISVARSS